MSKASREKVQSSIQTKTNPVHNDYKAVILFDGHCLLCKRSVQFVLRNDTQGVFKLSALQSPQARQFLLNVRPPTNLNISDSLESVVLIEQNHADEPYRVYTHSNAVLRILKKLGKQKKHLAILAITLGLIPEFIRDAFYKWVGANRYRWFGKFQSCWIPENHKDRFLR